MSFSPSLPWFVTLLLERSRRLPERRRNLASWRISSLFLQLVMQYEARLEIKRQVIDAAQNLWD